MKQQELVTWIKVIIVLIVLGSIPVFWKFVPDNVYGVVNNDPEFVPMIWPFLIYVWVSTIPFYFALIMVWNICTDIGKDDSYSIANIKRLKTISYLSLFECIYYAIFPIFLMVFYNAGNPAFFLLVMAIVIICLAFSTLAAILSHLAQKAREYKEDSELAV